VGCTGAGGRVPPLVRPIEFHRSTAAVSGLRAGDARLTTDDPADLLAAAEAFRTPAE